MLIVIYTASTSKPPTAKRKEQKKSSTEGLAQIPSSQARTRKL